MGIVKKLAEDAAQSLRLLHSFRAGYLLATRVGELSEHEVFVGEYETERVGFYALLPARDAWELDHFWIRPAFMGRGFGRVLFTHAVTRLKSLMPAAPLDIESDPNAESFYLHMGAPRVGEISRDWHGLKRTLPHLRVDSESSQRLSFK